MKRLLATLAAAALVLGCTVSAHAFSYQGALADIDGNPLTGNQTVEFRLYASETNGTALWGRTCHVLLDDNGLFNTEIADGSGTVPSGISTKALLDDVLAANAQNVLWLGITVGSSGEIAPRLCILPVPYAVYAHNVTRASGDFAAAGKVSSSQLAITGDATFAATATVSSNATVEGNLTVFGSLSGYGSVPVGTIVLWSGNADNIPEGWALCNGQTVNKQKTPDLRDRFVVGAGNSYGVGNTGGKGTFTLTSNQLPSHSHMYAGDDDVAYAKAGNTGYSATNNIVETTGGFDATSSQNNPNFPSRIYRTSAAGKNTPDSIDNRPPYYALCYIMRVK